MPEAVGNFEKLQNVISKLPSEAISPLPQWERKSAALGKLKPAAMDVVENGLTQTALGKTKETIGRTGEVKDFSLEAVPTNFGGNVYKETQRLIKETAVETNTSAEKALAYWDKLGTDAVEKFGANAEGNNQQAEGLDAANKTREKHRLVKERHQTIAESIINDMEDDKTLGTYNLFGVKWEGFADKAGIARSDVKVGLLKNDPAFQEYRDALVAKAQSLATGTEIDFKADIKNPRKLVGNLWNRFMVAQKVGLDGDTRSKVLANARKLTVEQVNLAVGPSLETANKYLGDYGAFLKEANWTVDNKHMLDEMPAISEELIAKQNAKVTTERDAAYNEAYDKVALDELEAEKQRGIEKTALAAKQREAEQLQQEAMLQASERAARMELNDLDIQTNSFARVARHDRQVGMDALVALAEKDYANRSMAEFNALIADGKLPPELDKIRTDVGSEVDLFITSKGKKGDIRQVEDLVNDLANLVNAEDAALGLPTKFLKLNEIPDVRLNISTGDSETTVVETGISVGLSDKGYWELRLATRQGADTKIDNTSPVIRFEPDALQQSFRSVYDSESNLKKAKALVVEYDGNLSIPGGRKDVRRQVTLRRDAAQSQVEAYELALAEAKKGIAAQLRTATVDGKLSTAFKELTDAQAGVAEKIFNADFAKKINELSSELDIPASQVTPEVLASLAASAEHSQIVAGEMSDYFRKVKTPGALQAEVIENHRSDIEEMAAVFAHLKEQELIASTLEGSARDAAEKQLRKQRKELEAHATLFGETINNDFIEAVPEALRKGDKAIPMTKTEFRKSVSRILDSTGFDHHDYQGVIKKGPNKGMTLAEVVRDNFTYDSEVQEMAVAATDALLVLGKTEAAKVLQEAIAEGDVEGFLSQANEILEKSTAKQFGERQVAAESRKLRELLSTPEGIVNAMRTGELYWRTAVDAVVDGKANAGVVIKGLQAYDGSEAREVRVEAARRLAEKVSEFDKPFEKWVDGEDPLAGNNEIADIADFAKTQLGSEAYWNGIASRARAEKKIPVTTE